MLDHALSVVGSWMEHNRVQDSLPDFPILIRKPVFGGGQPVWLIRTSLVDEINVEAGLAKNVEGMLCLSHK